MMRATIVSALAFALGGCMSSCPVPPPPKCPAARTYTALEASTLAAELPNDGPEAQAFVEDYLNRCPEYLPASAPKKPTH